MKMTIREIVTELAAIDTVIGWVENLDPEKYDKEMRKEMTDHLRIKAEKIKDTQVDI